jgi:hypothetical protein
LAKIGRISFEHHRFEGTTYSNVIYSLSYGFVLTALGGLLSAAISVSSLDGAKGRGQTPKGASHQWLNLSSLIWMARLVDTDLLIVEIWRKAYARFRPGYIPSLSHLIYFSGPALKDSIPKEFPGIDPQVVIEVF